ncbi:MAG: RNA-binding protein [Bacteroidota bacterium]
MNIFVAKLNYKITEMDLAKMFAPYGDIDIIKLVTDRDTGKSKGYAFIEMPDDAEGQAAIDALNGQEVEGFNIVVKKANPKEENRDNRRRSFTKRDDRHSGYRKSGDRDRYNSDRNDRYNKRY